ncbi:MAG: bifunctional nuclease family protein [Chloroflexi bacterium]|nr:bifunctional nuclease family protein [Chloroflexota bacterium]MCI0856247.1 bifunctional nuclease family protein [Chloroflexota bacterium]MCI0890259.1 bifunctional nuclease family protein [Chloroflexota bacterium]
MIEMSIEGIRVSLMNYQRVVILKEKNADRYLPIWIGPAEADAITVRLQDVTVARPLTHDLLRDVMEKLGAQVDCVVVNDLAEDTFFARIILNFHGERIEVDSRPSDAIALAVRVQVPIYAEDAVLDKAGVALDKEGQPLDPTSQPEAISKPNEEELERMSAFRDFIEGLDLDDFDKRKS